MALVAATLDAPAGYGRIVRGTDRAVTAIVEEADADDAVRAISEVNVGTYAFDAAWLRAAIGRVEASASGEYYLTDLVALAVTDGRGVQAVLAPDAERRAGHQRPGRPGRGRGAHAQAHQRRRTCATA